MEKQRRDNFWTWAMKFKFIYFLAFWVYTTLILIYYLAIIAPERFANSPIVTQFTTMAGSVIMILMGFFFGTIMEKMRARDASAQQPGTVDMQLTATSKEEPKENLDKENKTE